MKFRLTIMTVVILCLAGAGAAAQTFRIGSAAPENSPWGRALNRMAAEWQRISNGQVRVQVFHNAIAGDENDMVRKMRIGQLQAVVMTATGLAPFSDKVLTLSMPLLIRTQEEYDYVFPRVRAELEADIEREGFHVVSWSMAGWLRFFSKDPVRTPEELRSARLAASPEEMALVRAYQLMGYQPIPIPYTERLAGLANNMANSYLTAPILAAGFQWFAVTPNMTDLVIGPTPGAILMSDRAYRQLPAAYRDEMLKVAEAIAQDLNDDILELERTAIRTMVEYGLAIIDLTTEQREVWIRELEASYGVMLGLVFHEEFYRTIEGILREYRSR